MDEMRAVAYIMKARENDFTDTHNFVTVSADGQKACSRCRVPENKYGITWPCIKDDELAKHAVDELGHQEKMHGHRFAYLYPSEEGRMVSCGCNQCGKIAKFTRTKSGGLSAAGLKNDDCAKAELHKVTPGKGLPPYKKLSNYNHDVNDPDAAIEQVGEDRRHQEEMKKRQDAFKDTFFSVMCDHEADAPQRERSHDMIDTRDGRMCRNCGTDKPRNTECPGDTESTYRLRQVARKQQALGHKLTQIDAMWGGEYAHCPNCSQGYTIKKKKGIPYVSKQWSHIKECPKHTDSHIRTVDYEMLHAAREKEENPNVYVDKPISDEEPRAAGKYSDLLDDTSRRGHDMQPVNDMVHKCSKCKAVSVVGQHGNGYLNSHALKPCPGAEHE